jgi:hypothetical protein
MFSPESVFASYVEQLYLIVERENARSASEYLLHYQAVVDNWRLKGWKLPHRDPPMAIAVEVNQASLFATLLIASYPVIPKYPDPWDQKTPPPPEGQVVFAAPTGEENGSWYGTGSTVPDGTEATHEGILYRLVTIKGIFGTPTKIWIRME